jgi:acyl CoA:acetate/3-ketoacid CoA transferase alpha subunit
VSGQKVAEEWNMKILAEGEGELLGWHDPDENRAWILANKSRELKDKRMTPAQAVQTFVHDGDYIAIGGFGHVRVPMVLVYEIIRPHRRDLAIAGKTATHDIDILIGAGCVSRVEVAYSFGHELRGLSPAGRRAVESGEVKVVAEISNAGLQWRFLAGMMGIPFIPSRTMLGTDTFKRSACKVIEDPWSGEPLCAIPAAYPDAALFHVHRCDMYGNAQIDGTPIEDFELARAARRVLVVSEEIVDTEVIRAEPWRTVIPFHLVDAVCEAPYGAHPAQMPLLYFFDEHHIAEWLSLSRTPEGTAAYFDKYVFGAGSFAEYLEMVGGAEKLARLRRIERLEEPMSAPWLKK